MDANAKYLTTTQAGRQLGISRQCVLAQVRSGRIPAMRFGRDWLILESALAHWSPPAMGRPRTRVLDEEADDEEKNDTHQRMVRAGMIHD